MSDSYTQRRVEVLEERVEVLKEMVLDTNKDVLRLTDIMKKSSIATEELVNRVVAGRGIR